MGEGFHSHARCGELGCSDYVSVSVVSVLCAIGVVGRYTNVDESDAPGRVNECAFDCA